MSRIPPPRAWGPAGWLLILANLAPLWGVFVLGWQVGPLLWLYWQENLVIGLFAALRIATARGGASATPPRFFLVPFFMLHYGFFCYGHGVVLGLIANRNDPERFGRMFDLAGAFSAPCTGWLLLGLAVSHGASLALHWLRDGERQRSTPQKEMARPYEWVVVMHLTVMIGGAALAFSGAPDAALAGLAALKTAADLRAHFRAHRARFT